MLIKEKRRSFFSREKVVQLKGGAQELATIDRGLTEAMTGPRDDDYEKMRRLKYVILPSLQVKTKEGGLHGKVSREDLHLLGQVTCRLAVAAAQQAEQLTADVAGRNAKIASLNASLAMWPHKQGEIDEETQTQEMKTASLNDHTRVAATAGRLATQITEFLNPPQAQ